MSRHLHFLVTALAKWPIFRVVPKWVDSRVQSPSLRLGGLVGQDLLEVVQRNHLPNSGRVIPTRCKNAFSVGGKGLGPNTRAVPLQCSLQTAVVRAPDSCCAVPACCEDELTIRREECAKYATGMARQDGYKSAVIRVPHSRGLVTAGGDNALAVWRKRCRMDLGQMSLQNGQQSAVTGDPHPRRMIIAGSYDEPTVRREFGPHNRAAVAI